MHGDDPCGTTQSGPTGGGRMGERVVCVALAQMRVVGGDPAGNLARAREAVRRGARAGAAVVVLPECLDLGWAHPSAAALGARIPGPRTDALAEAAVACRVHIVAGLVERDGANVYNAAVLIDDRGAIVLHHRKVHELSMAHGLYALGDRVGVASTALGPVGLVICADLLPSGLLLGHALCQMGARLLLSPCAWAVPADHDQRTAPYGALWRRAYGRLARRHGVAVVGVSGVGGLEAGPWAGRVCIGCSLAVGPDGSVVAQGPYGADAEAVLLARLPLRASPRASAAPRPTVRLRRVLSHRAGRAARRGGATL